MRNLLAMVIVTVIMTAHTSIEVHMCGAFCSRSSTENPLNDLRLAVTLAAICGNRALMATCWLSVHCSMSSTSHVQSLERTHLPPCRFMSHRVWTNVETLSIGWAVCRASYVCAHCYNADRIAEVYVYINRACGSICMSEVCLAFFTVDNSRVVQHLTFKLPCSAVWQAVYDETNTACRAIRDTRLARIADWDKLPDARLQVTSSAAHIMPDTPLEWLDVRDKVVLIQWEKVVTVPAL